MGLSRHSACHHGVQALLQALGMTALRLYFSQFGHWMEILHEVERAKENSIYCH